MGEEGRKKITKITRYLSVILALVEAIAWQLVSEEADTLDKIQCDQCIIRSVYYVNSRIYHSYVDR